MEEHVNELIPCINKDLLLLYAEIDAYTLYVCKLCNKYVICLPTEYQGVHKNPSGNVR